MCLGILVPLQAAGMSDIGSMSNVQKVWSTGHVQQKKTLSCGGVAYRPAHCCASLSSSSSIRVRLGKCPAVSAFLGDAPMITVTYRQPYKNAQTCQRVFHLFQVSGSPSTVVPGLAQ